MPYIVDTYRQLRIKYSSSVSFSRRFGFEVFSVVIAVTVVAVLVVVVVDVSSTLHSLEEVVISDERFKRSAKCGKLLTNLPPVNSFNLKSFAATCLAFSILSF